MWNFSFICRASKADRNGLSPIELSIVINGKRTYVTLPMKVLSSVFAKKINSKRNNEILDYTSSVRLLLTKYCSEMMAQGTAITASSIKEYFINGGRKIYCLTDLRDEFLKYYAQKVEVGVVTAKVYRKYELVFERFSNYVAKQVGKSADEIEVNNITNIHIEGFRLELSKTMERTTISHILVKLKSFFIFAVNNGKIRINPFNQITIDRTQKEVVKLDKNELEIIKSKSLDGRLDRVRDLFLFQCCTGLAYCDMADLRQSDIQTNGDMYFVKKNRQKTKITFFTVINDTALAILEKYNYQLPVLSNQKYNAYLKEIGDICNISKSLHSHLARHTCATQLLNDGMSIEIVAKVLGHSNTRQTAHYARLLDNTVIDAFKKLK